MKRLAVVLLLAGCATSDPAANMVCIDRAQFGFALGTASTMLAARCQAKVLSEAECAALAGIREAAATQLFSPAPTPSGVDMRQLLKLLIGVGKLAM